MIESGNDPAKRGKLGEVSEYQILPKVWKSYTKVSFKPHKTDLSREVAIAHLEWLTERFIKRTRRQPNIVETYCMWNLGWTKFSTKYRLRVIDCPPTTLDAAMRLESVYQMQHRN